MLHDRFSVLAAAAVTLLATTAAAQCNPTKEKCPPAAAFGETIRCDFTKGKCSEIGEVPSTTTSIKYGENGAEFVIAKEGNEPTIITRKYLFFGQIDMVVKAAPGKGIATSAVLQSITLDEIDTVWVGGDDNQVQSNYLAQGKSTPLNGDYHDVDSPFNDTHTYSIEWTSKAITWSIDGTEIRTLNAADTDDDAFPQTPMQFNFRNWIAGREAMPEETREWAGGMADLKKGPYVAYLKSLTITDYAGGDRPAKGGVKEYAYSDKTGKASGIKVVRLSDSEDDDATSSTEAPLSDTPTGAIQTATEITAKTSDSAENANETETGGPDGTDVDGGKDGLSGGAIAGIVIGILVVALLASFGAWIIYRRKRRSGPGYELEASSGASGSTYQPEKPPVAYVIPTVNAHPAEVHGTIAAAELESPKDRRAELDSPLGGEKVSPVTPEKESPIDRVGPWYTGPDIPSELDASAPPRYR